MEIKWTIKKKRGNWRPKLTYEVSYEVWEKKLNLPTIEIESTIPGPPRQNNQVCHPGKHERSEGWVPGYYHRISSVEGVQDGWLPWRPGAKPEYPEVEESMEMLRQAIEKEIKEAYDSGPFEISDSLELSEETKKYVAPGVVAERMLANNSQEGDNSDFEIPF